MSVGRWLRQAKVFAEKAYNPIPDTEKTLFKFATASDLAIWKPFSDSDIGGRSTAALNASDTDPETAVFHGTYDSTISDAASSRLKRSGFAGITTRDRHEVFDIDDFDSMVFRVRGDGNKYLASLRTENWVVGDEASDDVWQAFLFARAGEWSDVEIPLDRFLLTHRGRLVETEVTMSRQRILSVAIAVAGETGRPATPFRLGLDWIQVRNTTRLDSPWTA